MILVNFVGVLALIVVWTGIVSSFFRFKKFNWNKNVLSDFSNRFLAFNLSLIIGGWLNLLFFYLYIQTRNITNSNAIISFFAISLLSIVFMGFFKLSRNTKVIIIHWTFAILFFVFYFLGIFLMSYSIGNQVYITIAIVYLLIPFLTFLLTKKRVLLELGFVTIASVLVFLLIIS